MTHTHTQKSEEVILASSETPSDDGKRRRNFCFTSYKGEIEWNEKTMKYLLQGEEICPKTGRKHQQGFVIFKNARMITGVIKEYKGIHFEICRGKVEDNITYCKKDNNFTEFGDIPKGQGSREDIREIHEAIEEGSNDKELIKEFGTQVIRMYRGIAWARNALKEEIRDWEMDVRIYWGKPGTGKTRAVWEEFGKENVYAKMVGKWWDRYKGQEVVLIDDFDPDHCFDMTFDFYLKLLDRYPLSVEWKGGSGEFYSKIIIFTSNFDPTYWFEMRDNREAFFRRVKTIRKFD